MLALAELPEVAADRGHRHETSNEDLVQVDEEAEGSDPAHDPGKLQSNLVAHEDDFLPLQHFPLRLLGAPLPLARLGRIERVCCLQSRQRFSVRSPFFGQLRQSSMDHEIGIATDRGSKVAVMLECQREMAKVFFAVEG